ncbi:G-protein coupled receptor moody isoform X3 [Parasteatoda tepidariorum]|uniref:G-protein coupled receptor moody isoform X3 n=1 Tax=Parasteatoda tepidariorum TaxID=114398 RepID=UPI00077FD673|nr:G-protein coupled receptor moody-like [Parasteatoda tepidariorum]
MNTTQDNIYFYIQNDSLANETLDANQKQGKTDIEKKLRIFILLLIAISCLGIIGNSITILALRKSKKLRSPTTAFIINLCTADMLFCVSTLTTYTMLEWGHNYYFCIWSTWARYFFGGESVYVMIAITVNRYICVVYPKYYRLIYKPNYLAIHIALTWLYALLLAFLPFFKVWGKYAYDPNSGICTIMVHNGKSAKTFFYITAFAFPTTAFAICYPRIFWRTYKASKEAKKYSATVTPAVLNATVSSPEYRADDKEMKILRVMLVIVVAYMICYFPLASTKLFNLEGKIPAIHIVGYFGVNFSNVINPIIYVAMSAEYRKAYLELFRCKQIWLQISNTSNSELISA